MVVVVVVVNELVPIVDGIGGAMAVAVRVEIPRCIFWRRAATVQLSSRQMDRSGEKFGSEEPHASLYGFGPHQLYVLDLSEPLELEPVLGRASVGLERARSLSFSCDRPRD